ncbi:MAG: hypothetical protein J0H15_13175 [Xanthomonadales bacterium]|nr:hypothetical protein [Xanthomonadales bacterium]
MTIIDRRGDKRFGLGLAAIAAVALACPHFVAAQEVSIAAGSSWQLGDGGVDLDCATLRIGGTLEAADGHAAGIGDLLIAGEASASTALLEVGGEWINGGSFQAGDGVVHFTDRCDRAAAAVRGSTHFSTLAIDSARGKAYRFEAGATQSVAQALFLAGAAGTRMSIGSSFTGQQAGLALAPTGSQHVEWLAVSDMAAPEGSAWLAPGAPEDYHSVDAGNNLRWFKADPAPPIVPVSVPTTSGWALAVLCLALFAGAQRAFRRGQAESSRRV